MPAQDLARLALVNGFRRGENGWGEDAFNFNFNKLSSLIHISVKTMNKSAPSSNDPIGTAYIVANNPSGAFASNAGDIAYRDLTTPAPVSGTSPAKWYFQTPFTGMLIYNESDNALYRYDNGWAVVRSPALWCRRYLPTQQSVGGSITPLNLTSAESGADALGLYNTSGKYLTIPESGVYDIRLHARNDFDNTSGNSEGLAEFYIYRGSQIVSASNLFSESNINRPLTHNCQYLGKFAAGERVFFNAKAIGNRNMTVFGGIANTYFDCRKVGN